MTDNDFDDLHHGYEDDPAVQAAQQQLAEAINNARQHAKDEAAAAARAENERRANDPRYTRNFERRQCWPECKPEAGYWGHTRGLGFCTEAHRPNTTALAAFVGLEAHLGVEESRHVEGGIGSFAAADMALVWLVEHPEAAAEIWPHLADAIREGDSTPEPQ